MKKIVLMTLLSTATLLSFAQKQTSKQQKKAQKKEAVNKLIKQEEEGAIVFNKQSAFGARLYTDGYGIFYELGRAKSITKTTLYSLEIGERKHPKEEKLTKSVAGIIAIGNPFIYGKQNNFYFAKLGVGQQFLIGGKGNKNGVAVSAIVNGGLAAGFLKPYYLNVSDNTGKDRDIKYADDNALFLDKAAINGSAGLGKGFKELDFVPGGHIRVGSRFDYGRYNEVLSAIEVGLNAEFYSKKMPIMVGSKEKNLFLNAYVSIVLGKRN